MVTDPASGAIGADMDANGMIWPQAWQAAFGISDWLRSNTAAYGTWTTTVFRIAIGGANSTGSTFLQHLSIESVPARGF